MSAIQNYIKEASKVLSETGKKTGLMVFFGEKESYIVPIFETFVVNHAIINFEITGAVILKYLKRLGQQEGSISSSITQKHLMRARNNSVYVAIDPNTESARIKRDEAGKTIRESHYMASECIFKPLLVGKDSEALDEAIVNVLSLCEVNFRRGLCNNIVLFGSVVLPGLSERLQLEIQKRFQGKIEVKVSSILIPVIDSPTTPIRSKK
jgi:actin